MKRSLAGIGLAVSVVGPVAAQTMCQGEAPHWTLELSGDSAVFAFPNPVEMDIPQRGTALGRDDPEAMTLIGDRDTAIVILEKGLCPGDAVRALVLTQHGTLPVLLTGCCQSGK